MRVSDLAVEKDVMLIYESIKLGRTIYQNIRKFIQYQLTIALNLLIFIFVGELVIGKSPFPPSLILFINYLMDTFSSNIFSHELPEHNSMVV
jgi:Ca2+-transporting ATPase